MQFQSDITPPEPVAPAVGTPSGTGAFPAVSETRPVAPASVPLPGRPDDVMARVVIPPSVPTAAPPPPPRELNLVETLSHLLRLLPGKTVATGLGGHQLGLTLKLDEAAFQEVEPVLRAGGDYSPYVPPKAGVVETPLNAHILIVEDTLVARLMLRRTLEQLPGCRITEAGTGREALAILNQGVPPDLCISDVSMPDMDGLTLLKEIRASPSLAHLDVMLCTASTERDTVLRAAELNVCRYLLKPYNPAEIKEQVRETLVQSATRQYRKLEELQTRVGLGPEATVEVLRGLSQQLGADVSATRKAVANGKSHSAAMTLQGLRGSCTALKDQALITRLDALLRDLAQGDLTGTLDGLELLQAEGRRVAQMADKFTLALANQALFRTVSRGR